MSTIQLTASKRTTPAKVIRLENKIPAVVYGNGTDNQNISVNMEEFKKVYRAAKRHLSVDLNIDNTPLKVVIKDYSKEPVKDTFEHIDFFAVKDDVKIIVPVPVEFVGESAAIKIGAILTVMTPYVKIKCLPKDVPNTLKADIGILETEEDKLCVKDIENIESLEVITNQKLMIAKVELPRARKAEGEVGLEGTEEASDETTEDEKGEREEKPEN